MKRIGVAFPGGDPASSTTWSGTTAGLMSGLEEIGVEPVALKVGASAAVRTMASGVVALRYVRRPWAGFRNTLGQARRTANITPAMSYIDTAFTPDRFGESAQLDGIVQIGSGYTLRTSLPIVTYEDMTVAQNRQSPYEQYALLSERALAARIERQRAVYEQAAGCCLVTDWAAQSVSEDYGVSEQQIHVVGIGHRAAGRSGNRDWKSPRYLFVGMDWERKNGPRVLRVFAQLRSELRTAHLDVVGRHPLISQAGVSTHGILRRDVAAERRKVAELFGLATCFVMPSLLEPAGVAYLEAMSAGVPVVGTTNGGASYLIGQGGTVVNPDSDDELLASLRRFADPLAAERTGAIGRQRAKNFTWSAVARRIVEAF